MNVVKYKIKYKNDFIKRVAFSLGLFFLALLGFFLLLHYISFEGISSIKFKVSKNYINLKKIDYKFFKKGKLAYEIFSENLNYPSHRKNIITLNNVKVFIYDIRHKKKPKYIITSGSGRLNVITKDVRFSGNVIIRDVNGSEIKTAAVDYLEKKDEFEAPGYIKITGKKYIITGTGLKFYVKKDIFTIKKGVSMSVNHFKNGIYASKIKTG